MQSEFVTVGSHTAAQLLVTMLDVKVDLVSDSRTLSRLCLNTEEGSKSNNQKCKRDASKAKHNDYETARK